MELKFKRLSPNAVAPEYQTSGAACFDLHAIDIQHPPQLIDAGNDYGPSVFNTGLSFEVPENHVMLIFSRSGHGFKNDARLANCVGVIDSDYRGEVKVKIACDSDTYFGVRNGDRIAQAMILPLPIVTLVEVGELSTTERGEGGFGSTGNGAEGGFASPYSASASTDNGEKIVPVKFMHGVTPGKTESFVNQADDGWIEWSGGECPVPGTTQVMIKLRNENTTRSHDFQYLAEWFRWEHIDSGDDIIAYRVVTASADTPAAQ